MEEKKSEPMYLYDIVKVELEEEEVEEEENFMKFSLQEPTLPPLTFSDSEVTVDPRTGQSICLLCLEEMQPDDVNSHMVSVHKYRRISLKCFTCGQYFQEKPLLYIHKQNCQPKKPVKRPSLQELLEEASEDLGNKKMCPVCLVEVQDDLKEHLEKNHSRIVQAKQRAAEQTAVLNSTPSNCPVCGKLFKSRMTLLGHIRLVHNSKKGSQECPECGQKFASKKYLNNHTRNVHPSDGRVHICPHCHRQYKSHQSLYQHIKYVHIKHARSAKKRRRTNAELNRDRDQEDQDQDDQDQDQGQDEDQDQDDQDRDQEQDEDQEDQDST